jgi:hypothetical protein
VAGALYDLVAVGLVLVVLRARPAVVLFVLGISLLTVPGPLVLPHSPTSLLTAPHLLTLAGAARLVITRVEGRTTREHLRVTPPQLALTALLLVASVIGVALSPSYGPLHAAHRLADVADHLVFLTLVLVLTRQTSPATVLRATGLGVLVGILITVPEHLTGSSYGHTLFKAIDQVVQSAAFPLSEREGSLRVRAGTEFALQYAWVVAMLAPSLVLVAWRRGGAVLAGGAAALALTSVYWSYSRTALAATAVGLLVMLVVMARRGGLFVLMSSAALGAAALLQSSGLRAHLDPNSDIGSIDVRSQRLAGIMDVASHHPFRGLGLGNLTASGYRTTDFAFLIAYVEMGVLGLVAVTACLLFALRAVLPSVLTRDATERDEGVAVVLGVGLFVLSTFTYDAFTLIQGTHALWLLVAAGIVLVERRAPDPPRVSWNPHVAGRAAGLAGIGFVLGLAILQLAPKHTAEQAYFTILTAAEESRAGYDPITPAERFLNTACGIAESTAAPSTKVTCENTFGAAGVGRIRIQAPNEFLLREARTTFTDTVRVTARVKTFRYLVFDPPRTGHDTWARTAPVWMAAVGGALSLLLNRWPAERSRAPRRVRATGRREPVIS